MSFQADGVMAIVLSALGSYTLRPIVDEERLVRFRMALCLQNQSFYGCENNQASYETRHFVQIGRATMENSLSRHGQQPPTSHRAWHNDNAYQCNRCIQQHQTTGYEVELMDFIIC